ncbi:uncharacterized protein N7484_011834 [Penicillium longicatenatum]|uniref:uncharacterized protein n=1 Tax=Penicillium longicatenatum TaxID=1561947 RepID=UPI0025470D8F|nr:uncharacterized protein N7484_011834 [Penicillium longicatenatum]KAJ5631734.1 hypothetical protein N7484_011834 [Penicillium longicatenatum]
MSADPPRRRRSSFSERFQRVFSGDRVDQTDKKRQSVGPGTPPTLSRVSVRPSDDNDSKSAATAALSMPDDAALSSFNFSSDSRIPSLSTTGSSASVHAAPKDEDSTQMTTEAKHATEGDRKCSSPTWGKEKPRNERRATKRLEAERKEMEKRMLKIEQSQTQQDFANFDRNSRRLVKKQKGSSERSSSAGSSRLRSSSLTRFFTRSRRGSQSGNESDAESTRGSTDTNPAAPVAPSIPLALEERFGADVSRELATRHGTTLIPASQLASKQSSRSVSSQPQKAQRLHHTPIKSDDLRENWKMAEEWQKTQGQAGAGLIQPENMAGGQQSPRVSLYGTDLDQELSLTSKNRRQTPKTPNTGSSSAGDPTYQAGLSSKTTPESVPQDDPSAMRITTVQQLREFSSTMSEESPTSYSTVNIQSPISVEQYPPRNRVETTPQSHQRAYKSSPLAMNPNIPDSPTESSNVDPSLRKNLDLPKPLRISKIPQFEEPQGRNQQSTAVSTPENTQFQPNRASPSAKRDSYGAWPLTGNEAQQESRNSRTEYQERQMPGESRHSHAIAPPKHPGRHSLEDHTPKWTSNKNPAEHALGDAQQGSKESQIHHLSPRRVTDGGISPVGWNSPDHRRSSISSQASSYNTADEEKLDVPPRSKRTSLPAPEPKEPKPTVPAEDATMKEIPRGPIGPRTKPPLASGPLSMLRKNPMQKMKPPRSDDVLAKLFVICCQCKYWHDMPSEVYAKFSSPERLPPGSRLARTFSRRNSGKNSIFSSDPDDPRRMPVPRRGPPNGQPRPGGGPAIPPQQGPVSRHQCCWCAHGMSKACCQGWTALVHMRERYH